MVKEAKKKWVKPKLIVLVRGRPEEGVLYTCKRDGLTGPFGYDYGVWLNPHEINRCADIYGT